MTTGKIKSFEHVYTIIGQQIAKADVEKLPKEHGLGILRIKGEDNYVYLYVRRRIQSAADPCTAAVATVIYQESDWHADEVQNLLKPLGLWNPGQFGVWVLVDFEE